MIKAWLNTPDGRKGWASWFIEQKYAVYIIDVMGMGRSSQNDIPNWTPIASTNVQNTEEDYTAPELINPYPQSQLHTQWPGVSTRPIPVYH
jgi:hypothetical protein